MQYQETITKGIGVLNDVLKLEEEFYKMIEDKGLSFSQNDPSSIERIEGHFNKTLDKMITLMNNSDFEKDEKALMNNRFILDMHGRFADRYNIDVMMLPQLLGPYNTRIFNEAVQDFKEQKF